MLTPLWRLVLAGLLVGLAWENGPLYPGLSVLLGLGALGLAVGWVRSGTVWLAWQAATQGQSERARRLLRQIPRPAWLAPENRAYHAAVEAFVAIEDDRLDDAADRLRASLAQGFRTDNVEATVLGMLASVEAARGEVGAAREALAAAEAKGVREGTRAMLAAVREQLEDAG